MEHLSVLLYYFYFGEGIPRRSVVGDGAAGRTCPKGDTLPSEGQGSSIFKGKAPVLSAGAFLFAT
ncbi:MAG: hypothetical protein COX36_00445 [Candidatus Nealsonbacteria bacterium CG23_combo_of_CG06-09_8_20_14_all_38_19]|uniref:Uncharacterized protein n=1 Tax=Candidatus Nealsonbacteria bacterium CG23_combo_of_CG06-09_8_20_14_all_38_19 TaxID=1974721 RepID=A0A2G9YXI0_9BACT|nr:MAG: hypothetical protein COX36_00445 [Candidatus Nealsonbacteria bacterium CG23_combo_of_CG06-09_8_20_14_all_38_19]